MKPIPVLLYHSISTEASQRFRRWVVTPSRFAEHMEYLDQAGYQPITVQRLESLLRDDPASAPERPVVITFDDGFGDFHSHALPVLEDHRFPCTLYVTTGYVGATAAWLAPEGEAHRRMLSWTELAEIASRGIEIGAHTRTHPKLDELPASVASDEITGSRQALEDFLQVPVASFAYPHGYYGPRVRRQVAEAGFRSAVAVRHAMSSTEDDPFALARIIVDADTTVPMLDRLLHGEGLPQAPYRPRLRTGCWRLARRTRAALAHTVQRGVHP